MVVKSRAARVQAVSLEKAVEKVKAARVPRRASRASLAKAKARARAEKERHLVFMSLVQEA